MQVTVLCWYHANLAPGCESMSKNYLLSFLNGSTHINPNSYSWLATGPKTLFVTTTEPYKYLKHVHFSTLSSCDPGESVDSDKRLDTGFKTHAGL